jgi:molybdopterin synthase catalytic subunit/molybdopterin converting factor small subunit
MGNVMRIMVRAYASYREAIGAPAVSVEVPEGSTPEGVWEVLAARFPQLRRLPRPYRFAINEEYVPADRVLRERDELVLLPPVSGGAPHPTPLPNGEREGVGGAGEGEMGDRVWVEVVEAPVEVGSLLEKVRHPQAGAVVVFLGTVRDNSRGRHVKFLEYEAYREMAVREMRRVAEEAQQRWPLLGIAIVHRVGRLDVGEISVAVAVSSGHRKEAFEAGRFAIDTLKQTVPIWKKEVWETGAEWVGSGG